MASIILSGGQVHKDEAATRAGLRHVFRTMREQMRDYLRAVDSAVYEFRKRAAKA